MTCGMTMMRHARELVFSLGIADCARNEVARGGGNGSRSWFLLLGWFVPMT